MSTVSYYFDAHLNTTPGTPDDPNSAWTNDVNAVDGSLSTFASNANVGGSNVSNELIAKGTTAPTTGLPIIKVRGHLYSESNNTIAQYGSWITMVEPSTGWTWATVNSLEAYMYLFNSLGTRVICDVYTAGKTGTPTSVTGVTLTGTTTEARLYKLELEITLSRSLPNLGFPVQVGDGMSRGEVAN